jgi:TolB-like protein/DNA-binding winged helix-turn-helix (wHTH) protein/Tfp pilus assembly protein PilF
MQELTIFRFGPFELRPQTRELFKGKTKLKLRPQPFHVLEVMLEHPGEVVSREKLRALLWSAGTYVDFEQGLNASIKELRGVLSDSASEPRYVETLPKLGYRIIVPVEVQGKQAARASLQQLEVAAENRARSKISSGRARLRMVLRRWPAIMGIFVVLIVALAGYFQWSRSHELQRLAGGRMMLAVLPFDNLTGDSGQDYFSDGLTEEMISQLGSLDPQRLGVIARTSVMHYEHSQKPLEQIGRELGVQYVLEGSVRRDAEKVRVSVQLIQIKDQSHLWAQQYDRELTGVLTLQGEIARTITDRIEVTIGGPKRTLAAVQPALSPGTYDAYDLYLKGRYFWNKRSTQGFERAVECFQQAIAKDPTYARAYAGLADSYALMSSYSMAPQNELMPKARTAALKALQLNEQLAEAHTSLALIEETYEWDWQNAEEEFRRAIQLDPNYATAHHWFAEHLAFQGRFDEAFSEIDRARQLDPLSLIMAADDGAILYFSRQYDRAIERFRATLDMEPNFPRAHLIIYAYVQKGQFAEALGEVEKWRRIDDTPWTWAVEAYVQGRAGEQEKARRALTKFEQSNRRWQMDSMPILIVAYTGMNEKEKAINLLQKGLSTHSNALTAIKVDPIYDPLRDDPRFQKLLRYVGLAQ